ncbi:two-component system sensor histidine kinase/response regulator [Bacteroidia bacterium]|nr:two-component system sensor histidine kinase/response regulator [Bacteroidia bacterium]
MKIFRYGLLLFASFVLEVNTVWTQELFSTRNNITYIMMDNGLLHNYIDDIYKDKRGFLWISTSGGGLSRYDGYEFTHYNTNTTRVQLKSNFIRNVCEDDFGRLWIASEGGIDILDPAIVQQVIPHDPTGIFADISNQQAIAVLKDSKGCIWMYCGDSLHKIRFNSKGDIAEIYTLASIPLKVSAIALQDVDEDGNIWAGLGNGVYKLYQGDNRTLKPSLVAPFLQLEEGVFISVFKAKEGDVWIGTDRGLIRYNRNKELIKQYHYEKDRESSLSQNYVTDLAITNDKQLIVSTLNGINIYNPITDDFEPVTQDNTLTQSSLNSNFVNCLLVDGDILWVGTETGGINKVTPKKLSVHNFIYNQNDPYSLSKNPVNAIYEDKNGYLWVGTVEGGVNRKSPGSNQFTHYVAESSSRLSHNSVSAITADKNNHLWIGTWGNGMNLFELGHPERPAIKYISTQTNPGFSVDFVGALCYDSINNGMWIGCNPGIFFYDLSTEKLIMPFPENIVETIHGVVGSIIDRQGQLWMGCMEGVYIIDLHSRSDNRFSYRYLKYKLDDPQSHLIEKITCFYQSDDGVLWLGSNGYGIYKYLPEKNGSGSFVSYTTKQGLINNNIKGILGDEKGHLWISTNNGLSCFDSATNRFTNYTKEDGLACNQFYWNAYCRSHTGILYFGGLNGLVAIDANRLIARNQTGKVVLTRLWVANEEILPGDKYIDTDISIAGALYLHESDKSFSLEFSTLNIEPQVSAVYSYRLQGFDDQWVDVPATRRFAGYTNLPPGAYSFQVKYIPEGTTEGDIPVTELKIIVSPFFYKTIWFILLMIFLTGCSILYLYKRRIRLLKNQQNEKITRQKKELIEMSEKVQELTIDKLAFFTNITHEFRTPITLIIGPIERALKLSKNPLVIEQLNFVERNSKYLLSLVNQLMDFRKVESGKLEIVHIKGNFLNFINSLLLPLEVFAKNRNIRIEKFYRLHEPDILFDQDAMQKVLMNLLSNAVKFTPDGGIVSLYAASFIDRTTQKETLFLSIKDTGTGIAEEDIAKIFDCFYQSRNHVKFPIYGQSGTGIGLYLCERIVQLQGGTIHVKNNRKNGCTFYVSLPLLREEGFRPNDADTKTASLPTGIVEEHVPAHFAPGKLTILIVEDNKDMRSYMHSILSEQYNILEAGNGAQALSLLSVHNVDFIISDWMMPVMDGLELSRKVKENFAISHIPFLMLTAKTAQEARIESYHAGVDEYIMKPFNEELLLTRISNILENRKRYQQQFAENMKIEALQMEEESSDEKFMRKVLEVIRDNYQNPYYESSDFIEAMGISKSLLNKKMQNIVGQSIGQFIRNYRLNIANELIHKNRVTRNMNISQIAYEVGFNDPKYFTRCFTKRFNIPPSSLLE